jgi:hypothetical protein
MKHDIYPVYQPIKDAVKVTGLSDYCIRGLIKDGRIKTFRSGVKWLVNIPDLLEQLEAGTLAVI